MKYIVVTVLLIVLVWAVVYRFDGIGSFDPSEQGRDAQAALKPGMTCTEVLDIAGEPRAYRPIKRSVERINGEDVEMFLPGPPIKFSRERLLERLAANEHPHGFVCTYVFSQSVAFTTTFDAAGTLLGVEDAPTVADLFQMKDR